MGKEIEVEEGILSLLLFVPQFMKTLTVDGQAQNFPDICANLSTLFTKRF